MSVFVNRRKTQQFETEEKHNSLKLKQINVNKHIYFLAVIFKAKFRSVQ